MEREAPQFGFILGVDNLIQLHVSNSGDRSTACYCMQSTEETLALSAFGFFGGGVFFFAMALGYTCVYESIPISNPSEVKCQQ